FCDTALLEKRRQRRDPGCAHVPAPWKPVDALNMTSIVVFEETAQHFFVDRNVDVEKAPFAFVFRGAEVESTGRFRFGGFFKRGKPGLHTDSRPAEIALEEQAVTEFLAVV